MYILKKNTISILMFSILILYQIIGVTIHRQYGFGIFYWSIQDYLLLILALFYIITNVNEIKLLYAPKMYLYHFYVLALLLFELIYIWVMPETLTLNAEDKLTIFHDTLIWYIISLVLMINFKRILALMTSKNMLTIYIIVVFFFFLYNLHMHLFLLHNDFFQAMTIGQSLPPEINKRTLPGYSAGFHLFFSPLFVIFSLAVILKLKDDGKYFLLYFVSLLTLYVLFLVGGRGTLISFFIVLFLFAFSRKAKVTAIIVIIILFSFAQMLESLGLLSKRMLDILTLNVAEDGSSKGRLELFEEAISIIKDNYILGVLRPFQPGGYPHSIISVWEEFGLLPFVLLLAIISHGTYLFIFKKTEKTFIYLYAKSIFFVTLIDHIFFKYTSDVVAILFIIISYYFIVSLKDSPQSNKLKVE